MKTYTVGQAFKLLKDYKITTQEESVRHWLREGTIQGIPPIAQRRPGGSGRQFVYVYSVPHAG